MSLTDQLDELRALFVERGCDVDRYLKPGLEAPRLREQVGSLGLRLPDELFELYAWRNGQGDEAEMSSDALRFRDNTFVDVSRSLQEYAAIQEYRTAAGPYGFDLRAAFPFAAFMGSRYAVICGEHDLASAHTHPVVDISEGVELFFHSLETMLATCIAWVQHPSWTKTGDLPRDIELGIWLRHNPGVFQR